MCVEDIIEKHTLPVENGKIYYISHGIDYLKYIILQTVENPDERRHHHKHRGRSVLLKSFPEQVGIHGFTGGPCYKILVILQNTNNQIITAYPTL